MTALEYEDAADDHEQQLCLMRILSPERGADASDPNPHENFGGRCAY